MIERVRARGIHLGVGAALAVVLAIALGVVVEVTPLFVDRIATWLTIAAAVIGLAAFFLAIVALLPLPLSAGALAAIQDAEAEAVKRGEFPEEREDDEDTVEDAATGALPEEREDAEDGRKRPVKGLADFYEWPADAVPIWVLADIVQWWRSEQNEGRLKKSRPGKGWGVGDIEHALRKSAGQGAHAWYVKFKRGKAYYRVASGGRNRREADPGRNPAVSLVPFDEVN